MRWLVFFLIFALLCVWYICIHLQRSKCGCGLHKESYMFNTLPKSASSFIKEIGGPYTISQTNDLPLVPDDQSPWFWSLDNRKPIYNTN
jgi:hypothetical protein